MIPDRTSAQVVDLASERPRLIAARRQRIQKAVDDIVREQRLKDKYRVLYRSRSQPPDNPEPDGDAA